MQALRFVVLAAVLVLIVRQGAGPFLSAAAGVLAARIASDAALSEARVKSPLSLEPLFHIGPVPVTEPVVVAWAVIALLTGGSALAARRLRLMPSKTQATLELVVSTIDSQIRDTMQTDPAPFRALIGSIFLFTLFVELVVAHPRRRAADRAYRNRRSHGAHRLCRDHRLGRPHARASAAIWRPSPSRPG